MADEWFYAKNGDRIGPLTTARLREMAKRGQLLPTDLVWREGQAAWKPANKFVGLFPNDPRATALGSSPPPLQPTSQSPNLASVTKGLVAKATVAAKKLGNKPTAATQNLQAAASQPVANAGIPRNIACPACRQPMTNDPSLAGQVVACPHCSRQFVMPESESAAAPSTTASSFGEHINCESYLENYGSLGVEPILQ